MKRKIIPVILSMILVTGALSGCTAANADQEVSEDTKKQEIAEETENEAVEEPAAEDENVEEEKGSIDNGWPWINSDLKENIHPDQPVDPKDDFHLYASMDWLSKAEIPQGYSGYTLYAECSDKTKEKAIAMFNGDDFSKASHNVKLAKQLYDLYKDIDAKNKEGVEPIRPMVDRILAVESIDDMNALFLDRQVQILCAAPVNIGVSAGIEDSGTNICWLDPMQFILGDAAEYSERTEYGDIVYHYKKDIFVYIMSRLGMEETEAGERFDSAIAYESSIAKVSLTNAEQMSADYYDRISNSFNYEDATAYYQNYPLSDILDVLGLKYDGIYNITEPEQAKAVDAAYTDENAKNIANVLLVDYVLGKRGYLDEDIRGKSTEIYNQYMGVSGELPLDERAYNLITSELPEQTAQAYVERYSSREDKERIENVCNQAIDTYQEMLANNEWASEETKNAAIEKLDAIEVHVGWPDKWKDSSALDISSKSLFEAIEKIRLYHTDKNYSELGKAIDKSDWTKGFNLLACNAFYDFTTNSINLIVGMMGEPFYWSDMSTEELYASLGAFWIGHELSHAFDSNGAQWDKNGNYVNWWKDEDKAEFDRRIDNFIEYLDTIRIMGDYYVKGSNVDSEMVADIIGLKCALKMAEKEENFDYKTFFEFYSDMNSSISLYSEQISNIGNDPHPLNYLRANVPVQQFEEFYQTYDVKEGDNMYLAPEKRLDLW